MEVDEAHKNKAARGGGRSLDIAYALVLDRRARGTKAAWRERLAFDSCHRGCAPERFTFGDYVVITYPSGPPGRTASPGGFKMNAMSKIALAALAAVALTPFAAHAEKVNLTYLTH